MVKKANTPWRKTVVLGMMAGAWIALGFVFFITSQVGAGGAPTGVVKVLGGAVFSVGLLLCLVTGADLFTSTTMTVIGKVEGRITWRQMFNHWALVWTSNLLGALLMATLIFMGGVHHTHKNAWGEVILEAASAKLGHSWGEAFVLGILCNICVCLAVWMAFGATSLTGKALAVVGPVALFVSTGMEHCVANMFLIPLSILIQIFGGDATAIYTNLNVVNFVFNNLIPVTLGNIVGGALFVGLPGWWVSKTHSTK